MSLLNIDMLPFLRYYNDNKTFNELFLKPFKLFYVRKTKQNWIIEEGKGRKGDFNSLLPRTAISRKAKYTQTTFNAFSKTFLPISLCLGCLLMLSQTAQPWPQITSNKWEKISQKLRFKLETNSVKIAILSSLQKGNLKHAQQFPLYDSNRKQLKIKIKMNLNRNIEDSRTGFNFEKVPIHCSLSFSECSLKLSILIYGQK